MSFPVYACCDSRVSPTDQLYIKEAITQASSLLPHRKFVWYGSEAWSTEPYGSPDWYLRTSRKRIKDGHLQTKVEEICIKLRDEPYQQSNPHVDILITSEDLYAEGCNFVFGGAIPQYRTCVISVNRFQHIDPAERRILIIRTILHELGHLCGLVPKGRRFSEENLGTHCTSPKCAMRQGLSLPASVQLAREESSNLGSFAQCKPFCPLCLHDLK